MNCEENKENTSTSPQTDDIIHLFSAKGQSSNKLKIHIFRQFPARCEYVYLILLQILYLFMFFFFNCYLMMYFFIHLYHHQWLHLPLHLIEKNKGIKKPKIYHKKMQEVIIKKRP